MAISTAPTNTNKKETTPSPVHDASGNEPAVPSGFILKLYQMVNGAPDEVIAWTPAGDAFIIGSDLGRLESETLPQYFRHNRFQSLVRQLNFYSFRKINRERNVWIYKHELFHRERPEDLHLVRRRTCPGVDGRKQRFSRAPVKKCGDNDSDKHSADDTSSLDDASVDDAWVESHSSSRKRRGPEDPPEDFKASKIMKRHREPPDAEPTFPKKVDEKVRAIKPVGSVGSGPERVLAVDMSFVDGSGMKTHSDAFANRESEDEELSAGKMRNERLEMLQQSMIVSEVALKLEEYAKKAMKGRNNPRTRRGGSGVVTPPFGATHQLYASARGLLTYDDELELADDEEGTFSRRGSTHSSIVVTDGDDSTNGDEERQIRFLDGAKTNLGEFQVPPVGDMHTANTIMERIRSHNDVTASVAGFCMSTPPDSEGLCGKILQLISSSNRLALEFQQYRAALHPLDCLADASSTFSPSNRKINSIAALKILKGSASRSDAVRDFKTFAVNCIQMVLPALVLSQGEKSALKSTAEVWLKSFSSLS